MGIYSVSKDKLVRIEERLPWRISEVAEGGFVAINDVLNLTTQAENFGGIMESIVDAQELLFNALEKDGELARFLKERGLRFQVLSASEFFDKPAKKKPVPKTLLVDVSGYDQR